MIETSKIIDRKDREAGFSLLELLLVVGIGALLLLAGIATYNLVAGGNKVNDATRVLATIKQQTQRAFQGQRDYADSDGESLLPTLLAMNAFPAGVLTAAGVPQHPWGGNIGITANGTTFNEFLVIFNDVPSEACVQLGTTFDSRDDDFVNLAVGAGPTDFPAGAGSIDIADLATACGTGASATMTWTFF